MDECRPFSSGTMASSAKLGPHRNAPDGGKPPVRFRQVTLLSGHPFMVGEGSGRPPVVVTTGRATAQNGSFKSGDPKISKSAC